MNKIKEILGRLGGVLIILAVIVFGVFYILIVKNSLDKNTFLMLDDITQKSVATVYSNVENQMKLLNEYSNTIAALHETDIAGALTADPSEGEAVQSGSTELETEEIKAYLNTLAVDDSAAMRYIISKIDGESFASDGAGGNLTGIPTFESAKNGTPFGARMGASNEISENDLFIASVPIKKGTSIIGVLSSIYMSSEYSKLIKDNDLVDSSMLCTLDKNGDILTYTQSAKENATSETGEISSISDLFDEKELETINEGIENREHRSIKRSKNFFTSDYISIVPFDSNEIYIVFMLDIQEFSGQYSSTFLWIIIVTIASFTILTALLVVFMYVQKKMALQLKYKALHDSLTDIPNKDMLKIFYSEIKRKSAGYMYLHIKVDNFENASEIFGYITANNIIIEIASILKQSADTGEIAARVKHNSFCMLLKPMPLESFDARWEKILMFLEELNVTDGENVFAYKCQYSCGVYTLTGQEADLIEAQNKALLAGQTAAENKTTLEFYTEEMEEKMAARTIMLANVETAFAAGQILPYMQSRHDVGTKAIVSAEMYARWEIPDVGTFKPNEFLPVFELAGISQRLDLYMLEEACKYVKKWLLEERMPVPLSVNMTKNNIYEVTFIEKLLALVAQHGIATCMIDLQFDQDILFDNSRQAMEAMQRFHDEGFILSIDDFGDETVPLDLLYRFPIDVINLRKSFLKGAMEDEDKCHVYDVVIDLAKKLGIVVAGKQVETQEEEDFFKKHNGDLVQGYSYSQSLPADEFEKSIF